jgi:hypothetical protein
VLVVAAAVALTGAIGARQAMLSTEPRPRTAVAQPAVSLAPTAAWAGSQDPLWSRVLRGLDERRGRAFAHADPGLLHQIYAPRSGLLARDARVINAYARRELHIVGLQMTILALHVVRHSKSTAILSVVDRISHARAVDNAGRSRELPHDDPTAHRVTLRRLPDGWRIDAISNRWITRSVNASLH